MKKLYWKKLSFILAFVMIISNLMIPRSLMRADEIVDDSRINLGLIGFEGDYALSDDDSPVSVIVLFHSDPAGVQVVEAQKHGLRLTEETAEQIVESEHALFRQELNQLFGSQRTTNQPFEIGWEFRRALNAVSISLPANRVEDISNFSSVKAVFPNYELQMITPVPVDASPFEMSRGNHLEGRDPVGMAVGRATMRVNDMHTLGYRGRGVAIAVIDTGIYYHHPAFAGAFLTLEQMQERNPAITHGDTIDGLFYGRCLAWNCSALNDPMEIRWTTDHGTHVAGTIVGRDTGRDRSILGIAPEAYVFAYRVFSSWGTAEQADVLAAIEMVTYDRPDVVNMSLGFDERFDPPGNTPIHLASLAVNNVMLAHPYITFVIAAGNNGGGVGGRRSTLASPGDATLAISVGAANVTMAGPTGVTGFSSRGFVNQSFEIKPDLLAHGADVLSTIPSWEYPGDYNLMSGTSVAAPHVAGAVALLIEYSERNVGRAWNSEEIKARLMNNAIPFSNPAYSIFDTGAGYVDVYAAAHADTVTLVRYDRVARQPGVAFNDQSFGAAQTGSFSFGSVGQLLSTTLDSDVNLRTLVASIENNHDEARTYTIEYNFIRNPMNAAMLTFSRRTITIEPGATEYFTASVTVGGQVAGGIGLAGFYEGRIIVRDEALNEVVSRLPFALVNQGTVNVAANRLSFSLGGTVANPVIPAVIDSINVNVGTNLAYFIENHHRGFTYHYGGFPADGLTRVGYIFSGWYLDANFETPVTEETVMPATNVTLHARWAPMTALTRNVVFNPQGGTWPAPESSTVNLTRTMDQSAINYSTVMNANNMDLLNPAQNAPTRIGYTFAGWFTAATGGTRVNHNTAVTPGATPITLHARWTPVPAHTVNTWDGLRAAINAAPANEATTIRISGALTTTGATNPNAINIPSDRMIILESSAATTNRNIDMLTAGQRHFTVSGQLTLGNRITLRGGTTAANTNNAGGILVNSGGMLTMLDHSAIQWVNRTGNDTMSIGGAVNVFSGVFNMNGGIIQNNSASSGGGVHVTFGHFTMRGGMIIGNRAINHGGGVSVMASDTGRFTLAGGRIGGTALGQGNTAPRGGGVFISTGNFTMNNAASRIEGNTATVYGGGIAQSSWGRVTISAGEVNSNTAPNGGGISIPHLTVNSTNAFTMTGGAFRNNRATAATGEGGAIFVGPTTLTANPLPNNSLPMLDIRAGAIFSGNWAGRGAFTPPSNAATATRILTTSSSVPGTNHPLNNFDINFRR